MSHTARSVTGAIVAARVLFAFDAGQAQVRPDSPAAVGAPYLPPRLSQPSPADGPLPLDPRRATMVVFRWQPAGQSSAGAPAPGRYVLCIMPQGSSCDAPGTLVHDVGKATLYNVPIPPAFAGAVLAWTAAACGPGYGAPAVTAGVPNADCTWAAPLLVPTVTADATSSN